MIPSEGITAAQTIRNMVLGVSILAAGTALFASQLLLLLTDPVRLAQVANYSIDDPISNNPLMKPEIKLGLSLAMLFVALLMLMQCVRLSVHLTFLLRAVPVDPKRTLKFQKVAFAINRRASLFFSLGLRIQYAFFPFFLYILGPLALLISTIVELMLMFLMDLTPDDLAYEDVETEEQVEDEIVRTSSLTRISLNESGNNGGSGGRVDRNGGEGLKPRAPYVSIE